MNLGWRRRLLGKRAGQNKKGDYVPCRGRGMTADQLVYQLPRLGEISRKRRGMMVHLQPPAVSGSTWGRLPAGENGSRAFQTRWGTDSARALGAASPMPLQTSHSHAPLGPEGLQAWVLGTQDTRMPAEWEMVGDTSSQVRLFYPMGAEHLSKENPLPWQPLGTGRKPGLSIGDSRLWGTLQVSR